MYLNRALSLVIIAFAAVVLSIGISSVSLDWLAFGLGTIGTVVWISDRFKGLEGAFWLLSGILWIFYAVQTHQDGFLLRHILGVALYAIGIITSIRRAGFRMHRSPAVRLSKSERRERYVRYLRSH